MWEGTVKVLTATNKALLVKYGKTKQWIPISQIAPESDIRSGDQVKQVGNLVIPEWLAREKGWEYDAADHARIQNMIEDTHFMLLKNARVVCMDCGLPLLFTLPLIRPNIQTELDGAYIVEIYEHYDQPKHRVSTNYILPYKVMGSLDEALGFRADQLRMASNFKLVAYNFDLPSYAEMEKAIIEKTKRDDLIEMMKSFEPLEMIFPTSTIGRISSNKQTNTLTRTTRRPKRSGRSRNQPRKAVTIELDEPGRRRLK